MSAVFFPAMNSTQENQEHDSFKKKKSFFSIYRVLVFKIDICGHNYPMKLKESALHNTIVPCIKDQLTRGYILFTLFSVHLVIE